MMYVDKVCSKYAVKDRTKNLRGPKQGHTSTVDHLSIHLGFGINDAQFSGNI